MKLNKEEILHIAQLARLELSEAELSLYGEQLSGILSFIDQLKEVDTENVLPTAQVTGLENVLRDDKARDWDRNELEIAFKQAPDFEDGQYKVKRVIN